MALGAIAVGHLDEGKIPPLMIVMAHAAIIRRSSVVPHGVDVMRRVVLRIVRGTMMTILATKLAPALVNVGQLAERHVAHRERLVARVAVLFPGGVHGADWAVAIATVSSLF